MHNYCDVNIKGKDIGVLFGVRLFQVIKDEQLPVDDDPNNAMNVIYMIYAAIKNNADLEHEDCPVTFKDVYLWANDEPFGFDKACECLQNSRVLGKPIQETANEIKKKTKKKGIFGKLFQKIVSAS